MKNTKKESARDNFKDLLNEKISTPLQKVSPVKEQVQVLHEEETQLMVWVPISLMVKIKTRAVVEKKSMKDLVNELLEKHI